MSPCLPLHAVLQAVDVFLMEGAPVLYRLALAAFALLESDLLACWSGREVEEVLGTRVVRHPREGVSHFRCLPEMRH